MYEPEWNKKMKAVFKKICETFLQISFPSFFFLHSLYEDDCQIQGRCSTQNYHHTVFSLHSYHPIQQHHQVFSINFQFKKKSVRKKWEARGRCCSFFTVGWGNRQKNKLIVRDVKTSSRMRGRERELSFTLQTYILLMISSLESCG